MLTTETSFLPGYWSDIFSIIAIIIAVAAFLIQYVRFRRERPNLHIKVIECRHQPLEGKNTTRLLIDYRIYNSGDRPTQLDKLELLTYKKTAKLQGDLIAHKFQKRSSYYKIPEEINDERIKCNFKLYHTHKEETFKITSEKTIKNLHPIRIGSIPR